MRKIREILRLRAEGFTDEEVARSVGCARSTVQECLRRARAAGIGWPPPVELDAAALSARLYPRRVAPVRPPSEIPVRISRHAGPVFHVMSGRRFT